MKRAVVAVVVVAAAFLAYRHYDKSYSPVQHYKKFAEQILHRQYDAASELTDGIAAKDLEKQGSQEKIGAGPAMFQTLFPSRFAIESTESVIIGVDPHKRSHTAAVVAGQQVVDQLRVAATRTGIQQLQRWANEWPERQ